MVVVSGRERTPEVGRLDEECQEETGRLGDETRGLLWGRGGVAVAIVSECVTELTWTLDLADREAGEGMALVAAARASKSKLSRFIPSRSRSAAVGGALDSLAAGFIPF